MFWLIHNNLNFGIREKTKYAGNTLLFRTLKRKVRGNIFKMIVPDSRKRYSIEKS